MKGSTWQQFRRGVPGRWITLLVLTVASTACTPPPKTVEYYREHPEERRAQLSKCANDPGRLGRTPDCINAREAELDKSIGSFKRLPPMGLLPEPGSRGTRDGETER